jgi:hypothetical protein
VPDQPAATTLTYGLRELVWGITSEVAVISSLSRRIDEHVRQINALRAELAERLHRLDVLTSSADNPDLEAFLRARAVAPLPQVVEHLPPRLGKTRAAQRGGKPKPPAPSAVAALPADPGTSSISRRRSGRGSPPRPGAVAAGSRYRGTR